MPVLRATGLMINRAFVLAASGVMSLAAAFAPQSAAAMPLGQFQALGAAAEQMSVVVPVACYKWEFFGDLGFCQRHCAELPGHFQANHTYWTRAENCDSNIFPTNQESCKRGRGTVMLKLTSCKASPGTGENTCIITVCGVTNALISPKPKPTDRLRVEQPVTKPRVGPPQPGSSALDRLGGGSASSSSGGGGGSAPKPSGGAASSSGSPGAGSPGSNINSSTIKQQSPAFGQTPGLR